MSIWILAFLLCVVFAVIGFFSGAIRTGMMLLGVMIASMVTGSIAPKLAGLMPKIGIKHPLWIQISPYIIVFAVIALAVFGIGFFIHHKVATIYKNQRDDFTRMKWERMVKNVGLSIGLFIGLYLLFTVSRAAYPGGYLTAQVADESSSANNPAWVNFLTALRSDMQATGLDKAVAALDKTPARFYDAADVVGLVYHNPALQSRLANYPPFLTIGQDPLFQEMSTDKDYNDLIFGKAPFGAIINHPSTQRLIANQEILSAAKQVDVQDLLKYLKTGKSKYDEEKILGRWILDKDALLTHIRKTRPNIKGNELKDLKKGVELLPELILINTPEHKSIVKTEGVAAAPAADPNAAPAPPPAAADPYQMQRGRAPGQPGTGRGGAAGRVAARTTRPTPTATPPPVVQMGAVEGEWKQGALGQYELAINDAAGKAQTLVGTVTDDELTVSKNELVPLVFFRAQ